MLYDKTFTLPYPVKYPYPLDVFFIAGVGYTVVNAEDKALETRIKLGVIGVIMFGEVIGADDFFQFELS